MRILGLEWHRWVFFFMAWVPWLAVTIWYFKRMKDAFRRNPDPFQSDTETSE